MRPYILAETNWHALKEAKIELAILPWGATEAHNFHLPYATDNIESDWLSAKAAQNAWEMGAKVMVLPTVPYGVNTGQRDVYLDIGINPSTLMSILADIVERLNHQEIYKLMILNSHGGNDFKPFIRELGLKYPKMFLTMVNWYLHPNKEDFFNEPGDHAGEMETSLMLYFRPDLVLPKEKWGQGKEKKAKIKAFREGWAWTERKWPLVTLDTGIGNPEFSTSEKGERFFVYLAKHIGELMVEICSIQAEKLYE